MIIRTPSLAVDAFLDFGVLAYKTCNELKTKANRNSLHRVYYSTVTQSLCYGRVLE